MAWCKVRGCENVAAKYFKDVCRQHILAVKREKNPVQDPDRVVPPMPTVELGRKLRRVLREATDDGSWVYFIECGPGGPIKIGVAINVAERLHDLQCANPFRLRLLGTVKGSYAVEAMLHKRFEKSSLRGEWFSPTADLLEYIDEANKEAAVIQMAREANR